VPKVRWGLSGLLPEGAAERLVMFSTDAYIGSCGNESNYESTSPLHNSMAHIDNHTLPGHIMSVAFAERDHKYHLGQTSK